jgi:hypothetical protein
LPTAIIELERTGLAYPASNYPHPTSSCPFATVAYFSSSGIQPINKQYNGNSFNEVYPPGEKIVALVYDGTFEPQADPNAPNAVTVVGYVLLEIDGYGSSNPKNLDLDLPTNKLGTSGNTAYAHALSDIVEPTVSGICDQSFIDDIFDLQLQGAIIKLVQ